MPISIRRFLDTLIAPAEPAYTTIIYPAGGMPVIVHDGLGIARERPWYQVLVIDQEDALSSPLDIQAIGDGFAERLSLLEGPDAGCGFLDDMDDLMVPVTMDFATGEDEYLAEFASLADTGSSIESCSPFEGDTDCFTGSTDPFDINPASGLPMIDSSIDVGGNLYGMG